MKPKPCYNCNILHRVTLLLLFLGGFSTILAQKNLAVRMKVADEFSGDTIGGLKCDILNAADSAVLKSARVLNRHRQPLFGALISFAHHKEHQLHRVGQYQQP